MRRKRDLLPTLPKPPGPPQPKTAEMCLFPDCTVVEICCRGICRCHYEALRQRVASEDDLTWAKLEKMGLCLPRTRQHAKKRKSHIDMILEKKRKEVAE